MRIYHNQLGTTLNSNLKPVWLIFGDEPWQKNDSLVQIKSFAQQQGFSEIIRFSVDEKFDWQRLVEEYQSLSLFASQRIIEIELVTGKIGDAGSKTLVKLTEQLHQDVLLIFHGPKLDAATQKRKWFKALEQQGIHLPIYDMESKQLQQWLQRQARQQNINLHPQVIPMLVELFEGNVPALAQELEKLSLLFGQQQITVDDAEQLIIKQAKFNPFQLIDALLTGNTTKCITILDQLQHEGTSASQLIWFIHKEIQQLFTMLEQMQQGENINSLYKQFRIWEKRKPFYQYALTNITIENIRHAQARLAQVDLISKTSSDFNPFILLADVCLSLFHGQTLSQLPLSYEYN